MVTKLSYFMCFYNFAIGLKSLNKNFGLKWEKPIFFNASVRLFAHIYANTWQIYDSFADQALTSRAFLLRVGFGSGLTKKFGFQVGFGYCAYFGIKANSFDIVCNSTGCLKKSFCGLIQIGPSYQWVNFKCFSK